MDYAWCAVCRADVSVGVAATATPCQFCGSTDYVYIAGVGVADGGGDVVGLLAESERMMRLGRWGLAAGLLGDCISKKLVSEADYRLSMANLDWRKLCVSAAGDMLAAAPAGIPLPLFKQKLTADFDAYVVGWLLKEYKGLRLSADGGSYRVRSVHGEEA